MNLARDPGYVLVGPGEAVHTRHIGTRAAEHAIPARPDEAATVHHLLTAGRLHHGSRITVTVDGAREPESATVVEAPAIATSGPADFSGAIVRQDGTYLVETEHGDVIGRARSYRAGAERLARHHGYRADPVEVEHEHEVYR